MAPSDFTTNTTRRFHRTTDQAFPFGPSYGNPIQGPYRRGVGVKPTWLLAIAAVFGVLVLAA